MGLDKGAREALGTVESADLQKQILEEINPSVCRNPSAVVIRKVVETNCGAGVTGETAASADKLGLDEAAKEALGKLSEAQQKHVIRQVNPDQCRNPSAVVIKEIVKMKQNKQMEM